MNILIVAQYFPPDLGGSATRAYNISKGLMLNGYDVTVIAAFPHYPHGIIPKEYRLKPITIEWMGKIKVIRTLMPPMKSQGFFKRLVLIGMFSFSSLFALPFVGKVDNIWASSFVPGYIYKKVKKKPLALNVDDLTLEDLVDLELLQKDSFVSKVAELVYRLFFVKGDALTPISPGYLEILSKKYCVEPGRLHVIRGGVDLSVFKPTESRSKLSKKFVVLYSGAFSVAYDFIQIIRAAKIVEKTEKDVEFVIQGTGELSASMARWASEIKTKNIRIIDRILMREEVAELLSQSDALILPLAPFHKSGRPYRGMSSKLYEYQAVGKPIICCSRGVPSDYIQATQSGIVVNPGDYKGLAEAVLELKRNPQIANQMGMNGRKYVEQYASLQAIGLEIAKVLNSSKCGKTP